MTCLTRSDEKGRHGPPIVTEQISARLAPTSIPAAPLQLWELHGLFSQFLRIEGTTFFLAKGHTFQRPRRLLHKKRPAFQKPQRFVADLGRSIVPNLNRRDADSAVPLTEAGTVTLVFSGCGRWR